MKNKWPQRHYIDLFSGAGRVQIRDSDEELNGSALIARHCNDAFTRLHLCERDQGKADALESRLRATGCSNAQVTRGDANEVIDSILEGIPSTRALSVTFADPYGLHLDFETVRKIAGIRSDLIVLLADNMDALRNWATYYFDNENSNLDRFMGESGWRDQLMNATADKHAQLIRDRYCEQLQSLKYEHFGWERVSNDQGRDIYTLLYASRHAKGLEFWNKASVIDEGGQRSFGF